MKTDLSQHKVFIANRGEVVSRVCRTLKKLNIASVGLACQSQQSHYIQDLDEVIWLEEKDMQSVFTHAKSMVDFALKHHCTAIHPGWGFLSENADFAQQCQDKGIIFIGPKPESIRLFADKAKAKTIAVDAGLKVLDSINEANFDSKDAFIKAIETKMNLPIILKPALGGGGKGMTIVHQSNELKEAVASAKRIAQAAFADGTLLAEPYLEKARHVEVQVFSTGKQAYHFKTRDCTMQRRYQKIIEESHSTFLNAEQEAQVCKQAVDLVQSIAYESLGTVEFIIDQHKNTYFMEMNTRLQVEHGVTELIYDLDLLELQIKHALGEAIFIADDMQAKGHAIQVRVYAENALKEFMPATGKILGMKQSRLFDRVECDVELGTQISSNFDPMMAKFLVWAETRDQAIMKMLKALHESYILGLAHNLNFVTWLLESSDFIEGEHDIQWIDRNYQDYVKYEQQYLQEAGIYELLYSIEQLQLERKNNPWYQRLIQDKLRQRIYPQTRYLTILNDEVPYPKNLKLLAIEATANKTEYIGPDDKLIVLIKQKDWLHIQHHGKQIILKQIYKSMTDDDEESSNYCKAPLNGMVKAVYIKQGQEVKKNELLLIIEAMKMEYKIVAPRNTVVKNIMVVDGLQVEEEQPLLELESETKA
ncbi:MAG TPA: biotin carboxylase N-terminal domain-containing protein [Oligoflexia bacterium]|nr:biotin carboxylase N-terminal domain-containing protein [Oligoflexia bacterium]HMR23985.1 biotin carboxylase N-terminal domain-containing protein [Oligoflexia bacterium]